MFIFIL